MFMLFGQFGILRKCLQTFSGGVHDVHVSVVSVFVAELPCVSLKFLVVEPLQKGGGDVETLRGDVTAVAGVRVEYVVAHTEAYHHSL